MKNILISLFIFIFTLAIVIYNFYRKAYVFGWIAIIFAIIDFVILVFAVIKVINKR